MLRPLVGDLTRKGIVRPLAAGVGESAGTAHASSENHSNNRVGTTEKRFGIISDEWIDRAILEFQVQARESGESYSPSRTTAGWGGYASKGRRVKFRNGGTSPEIPSF